MDLIVTYAIRVWIASILAILLVAMLVWLARGIVRALRVLPSLRTRLAPLAARMERWTDRSWVLYMAAFFGGALWPVLLVALPVAGVTWLLFRWLVPDTTPVEEDAAHAGQFPQMEWPLRLVTVTTIAQLLTAATMLWFVKVPSRPILLGTLDGASVQVDLLVVITVAAFLPIGFGMLLAGAWVRTLSRGIVLAVIAVSARPPVLAGAPFIAWMALVAAAIACTLVPIRQRQHQSPTAASFVTRAALLAAGLGTYLVAMAMTLPGIGHAFPTWLDRMVSEQVFMVAPVLFLAGVDFVGMGMWVGTTATRWTLLAPWKAIAAVVASTAAVASAALAIRLSYFGSAEASGLDASGLGSLALVAAAGAALVALLTLVDGVVDGFDRFGCLGTVAGVIAITAASSAVLALFVYTEWRPLIAAVAAGGFLSLVPLLRQRDGASWSSAGVTMTAIAVMAVVMAGGREVVVLVRAQYEVPPNARSTVFRVEQLNTPTGPASLALPTFWTLQPRTNHLSYGSDDPYTGGAVLLGLSDRTLASGREALEPFVADMLRDFPYPDLSYQADYETRAGRWRRSSATIVRDGRRYLAEVYDTVASGRSWVMVFLNGERYARHFAPAQVGVVTSWRFNDTATTPQTFDAPTLSRRVTNLSGFGFLPVLFAPVGLWLLYGRRTEPPTGTYRDHAAVLAVFVAATAVLLLPDTTLVEFWSGREPSPAPLGTLQVVLAGATILLTALFAVGQQLVKVAPLLREFAVANIGLLFMAFIYALYGQLIPLGNRSVAIEVGIFVAGLLFDMITSGREITSGDSPRFPRPARVLSYLGYIVVVSTITLFISTQTLSSGAPLPKLAESEDIVRQGLVWLGAPVLLLRMLLRWLDIIRTGTIPN